MESSRSAVKRSKGLRGGGAGAEGGAADAREKCFKKGVVMYCMTVYARSPVKGISRGSRFVKVEGVGGA